MYFTREPVVETVISAKDGYKLVIRSSKSASREDYFVDSVEIVSFNNAFFFRSLEQPYCFIVPINDYELFELRKNRTLLKCASLPQPITAPAEIKKEKATSEQKSEEKEETKSTFGVKKRERSRQRRRSIYTSRDLNTKEEGAQQGVGSASVREEGVRFSSQLIPPPPNLISERFSSSGSSSQEAVKEPDVLQSKETASSDGMKEQKKEKKDKS